MAVRAAALCLLLAHQASPALAQAPGPIELIVTQGGKEIGRESFTLAPGRGRGAPGTTLSATARYPAAVPTTRLTALLERTPESAIAKFQLDVDGPEGTTVILAAGTGARLVVRTVAEGSESGRELPGGPDVVLLDDEVHSLYVAVADLATSGGKRLTAIFPRTGRRAAFTARREDGGQGGRRRVALTGDIAGTLVTDAEGRLHRLELPAQNKVVTRAD
ncbi:MAG TPA: hypothetical protein VHG35_16240 [Gemmatimonadales bacterium]|nr:hypothetical protein [Gemmatimonadales bacterium]